MPHRTGIARPPVLPVSPVGMTAPAVDIADESYVRVIPGVLAPVVADPRSWGLWWPDLQLVVTRDRGELGQQWAVTGALRGSMEVWLEAVGGGTVVHWYLREDPPLPHAGIGARHLRRSREGRVLGWKAHMFGLKDRLETQVDLKDPFEPAESI